MPEGPQGKIFINYRRDDDPGFTTALYMHLEEEFGRGRLFMDVEGYIKPGDDFTEVLSAQVAQCDVLLAVIGPRWAELLAARAGDAGDFVVVEIKAALDQGKRVIPVLVGKAGFPRADNLPEAIHALARKNAVALRHDRFKADCQGLSGALKEALETAQAGRLARTEAERQAAEAASKQREAEEEARAAEIERAAREQALAGLTPEQIHEGKELANWEFIKDRQNIADLRDHLARFAGGPTERYARAKLEALVWADPATQGSIEALTAFLAEFPQGDNAGAAEAKLRALERERDAARQAEENRRAETEAWAKTAGSENIADLEAFLNAWPSGEHAAAAKARIRELRGGRFTRRGLLKGVGIGVGASALAFEAFVPGQFIWRQINDRSIRTFTGHTKSVGSVAISPDGRTALSGSDDNTLKLWDLATGKELRTFTGHTRWVRSVALSPDGRTALSGSDHNTLKLWELATGKELRTFTGHTRWVRSVVLSPDGRTALSGSDDNTLKLWDLATGKELRTFTGHTDWVRSVALSPDGRTVLSGSDDKALKLWDLATGKELRTVTGHTSWVRSVALSPDGRTALSGGWDDTVKLWDLATGKELRTVTGHTDWVRSVALSPDGRTALSGGWDDTLKLWDLATGKELRTVTGHAGGVNSVAISPDGRTALSGSDDNTLKLWDLTPYLPASASR